MEGHIWRGIYELSVELSQARLTCIIEDQNGVDHS